MDDAAVYFEDRIQWAAAELRRYLAAHGTLELRKKICLYALVRDVDEKPRKKKPFPGTLLLLDTELLGKLLVKPSMLSVCATLPLK